MNDGVIVFMRVIDNEEEVPRGGPVAELTRGEGAGAMRTMYSARRALCDDDHHHHHHHYDQLKKEREEENERVRKSKKAQPFDTKAQIRPFHRADDREGDPGLRVQRTTSGVHHHLHRHRFADYMTTNGRMLSVYAMKRMRFHPNHTQTEIELPQIAHYFAHMTREVYLTRHAWIDSKSHIARLQGLIRMRLARRRVALIKQQIEDGIEVMIEAEHNLDVLEGNTVNKDKKRS